MKKERVDRAEMKIESTPYREESTRIFSKWKEWKRDRNGYINISIRNRSSDEYNCNRYGNNSRNNNVMYVMIFNSCNKRIYI